MLSIEGMSSSKVAAVHSLENLCLAATETIAADVLQQRLSRSVGVVGMGCDGPQCLKATLPSQTRDTDCEECSLTNHGSTLISRLYLHLIHGQNVRLLQ